MNSSSDSLTVSNDSELHRFGMDHGIDQIYMPHHEHAKLVVTVYDTGIGIKKEDQLKLFKLFGTLQNTIQMNTNGIGLGLVISENIIKAFGGKIGVKSEPGKGSKFVFSIVLDQQENINFSNETMDTGRQGKNILTDDRLEKKLDKRRIPPDQNLSQMIEQNNKLVSQTLIPNKIKSMLPQN